MTTVHERPTNFVEHRPARPQGETLSFYLGHETTQWDQPTIYNPSVEFLDEGRTVMLCRLEESDDELSSVSTLFEVRADGSVEIIPDGPRFPRLQDPYYLGEFTDPDDPDGTPWKVIGGVQLTIDDDTGKLLNWQDTYYRYKHTIMELSESNNPEPFLVGPHKNKDMRAAQTDEGVAVFPRPQSETFGGGGSIGFFMTKDIPTFQQDLGTYFETGDNDTLIQGIFDQGEWGGVNQVLPQPDGTIILVGHKASKIHENNKKVLCYRPFVARFDPQTKQLVGPLYYPDVAPTDFGDYTPKPHDEADLTDVLFTAGILPHDDPTLVWLITGIGDAVVGKIAIPNPLLHMERVTRSSHGHPIVFGAAALRAAS